MIRVLVHQTEIIIGAQCDDDDPAGIVSFSKARDSDLSDEDYLEFVLDTFGDQRSGYVFAVNPGGASSTGSWPRRAWTSTATGTPSGRRPR